MRPNARRSASANPLDLASAATNVPQNVSPAPVVSSASISNAGCSKPFAIYVRATATRAQRDDHVGIAEVSHGIDDTAACSGNCRQFALIDDQDVDVGEQLRWQYARRRRIEDDAHPGVVGGTRPGGDGLQRRFQLQEQVRDIRKVWQVLGSQQAFAPGATVIAFSASSDRQMKATPVASFATRMICASTPASRNERSSGTANASEPSASNMRVWAPPARAQATAWLAPLPPGKVMKLLRARSRPAQGCGKRGPRSRDLPIPRQGQCCVGSCMLRRQRGKCRVRRT